MPSMECPVCDGTGYVQEEDGATTVIFARCEGTGVVFVDVAVGDAIGDAAG